MTETEVHSVEVQCGVALPPVYRGFLLHFPEKITYPEPDDESVENDTLMFHTVKSFMVYRQIGLDLGMADSQGKILPWPDDYFVIGSDGGGGLFCIRINEPGEMIYFYDHESGDFSPLNRTLEEHAVWVAQSNDDSWMLDLPTNWTIMHRDQR